MLPKNFGVLFVPVRSIYVSSGRLARNIKPWKVGLEGEIRQARAKKIFKIELPDFEKLRSDEKLKPEEYLSKLKEKGVTPPRKYQENPILLTCIQGVLDPYVPPEGDGKYSILSQTGVSQKASHLRHKATTMLAIRKIRSFEDDFDVPLFTEECQKIYIKAHELLAENATTELFDYVTEFAYPLMKYQTELKTIKWKFIKNNEEPQVIQVRTQTMVEKNNYFAQITVRFNSRQILAIYDRFGHLMHGSEAIVKDVIEYVVFEKNISNYYGKWRIHSKIIPDWLPQKEPIRNTFVRGQEPDPPTEEEINFEKQGIVSDESKAEQKEAV